MKKESGIGEWDEQSLGEISGSYWKGCALQAAVKLDFFTILDSEAKTAGGVASSCGGDLRGVSALLNALTAMGLLEKQGELYSCSAPASRFLSRSSGSYIGWKLLHHYNLLSGWSRLDEAVIKGKPIGREHSGSWDEERRESFLMAMFNNASAVAGHVVPEIDLATSTTLLDLGGGPGTYAINFCRENPQLQAVVFDLPESRPYAEKTIRDFKMEHRISFEGGDFLKDKIPGSFDVVWISHVLHSSGPKDSQLIIDKAAAALNPGGKILVHDFWMDDSGDGPVFPALFALNMLVMTEKGQTYTETEVVAMLEKAGLVNILRLPLSIPNQSGVVGGEKKM